MSASAAEATFTQRIKIEKNQTFIFSCLHLHTLTMNVKLILTLLRIQSPLKRVNHITRV